VDDAALLARMAASDPKASADREAAITEFNARWFPQFARLATRLTGNADTGEDIAQEAIVRVIVGAGRFEAGRAPRSWLLAIVYNIVRDRARRKKVRRETSLGEPAESDEGGPRAFEIEDREQTVEEQAEARERDSALRASLAKLSDDDRAVILLRDYEGLTGAEAAQVLGISVEKVGARLFRARKRLAAQLHADWPDLFPTSGL
jgi:RNA polymerase sigma-70 factor, ECF subfamily